MRTEISNFVIEPKTLTEAMNFATMIASSSFCPSSMKNKPGDVILAMQMGSEVGLSPMQAIQNVAVINGRPCLWGDAALAVAMSSANYVAHREWMEGTIKDGNLTAYCGITRRNNEEHIKSFSMAEAKVAGLWGKSGPWTSYPERMLQMRARSFAIRDKFADVLRGINIVEEVRDYDVKVENRPSIRILPNRKVEQAVIESKPKEEAMEVTVDDLSAEFESFNNALEMADSLDQLKAVFNEIKKKDFKKRPDLLKKLIDAKDERKSEIELAMSQEKSQEYDAATGELTENE